MLNKVVCEFMGHFDLMVYGEIEMGERRTFSKPKVSYTSLDGVAGVTEYVEKNMICYLHCTLRYKDELRVSPSVFVAAQAYEPPLSRSNIVRCSVSVFSPVILMPCWKKKEM